MKSAKLLKTWMFVKLNTDLFNSFICQHFSVGEFSNEVRHADVITVHKKRITVLKLTISQLVCF